MTSARITSARIGSSASNVSHTKLLDDHRFRSLLPSEDWGRLPVAIWRAFFSEGVYGHAQLVAAYMRGGGFTDIKAKILRDGGMSDPMAAVVGRVAPVQS